MRRRICSSCCYPPLIDPIEENKFIKYIINPFEQYENWMGLDDRLFHDKQVRDLLNSYNKSNTKKKRKSIEKKIITEITSSKE